MVEQHRRQTLTAALAFLQLPPRAPELRLLHRWLDSWTGVGLIAVGLHRQGWDLQLTQYGDGNWRATFYVTGAAHSIVGGAAWEPTAWGAVQMVAWAAVKARLPKTGSAGIRRRLGLNPHPVLHDKSPNL